MMPITLAAAGLLSGLISVQTSVTTWLVFDPSSENRLEIDAPAEAGGATGTRLVGGVLATLTFDATKVLLDQPLTLDVRIDEIRIAGESFAAIPTLPDLQTGTICVVADPAEEGTGTVTVPLLRQPQIDADMRTVTFLTSPTLGALFPDGISLAAHIRDELEVDLRALLLNRFASGPVAVDTAAQGVVPADLPLLGGQPFRIEAKILNSLQAPQHPLLDECAAFLGGG
ncbi:MAG TPA: hypothetical protein VGR62_09525 [Candidatus Binatia bacterium]|nr:hypothetical protein [Candidatus Binatia bacterium]